MKVSSISKVKSDSLDNEHYHIDHNQDEFIVEGKVIILQERKTNSTYYSSCKLCCNG